MILPGKPAARRDLTLQELADVFLERHGTVATARTVGTLRGRLVRPLRDFGTTPLSDLDGMTDELAAFAAALPDRYRYSVMSAFRQTIKRRRPLRLHDEQPREADREESATQSSPDPRVHPERAGQDHRGARRARRGRGQIRCRDRATSGGMGARATPRHTPDASGADRSRYEDARVTARSAIDEKGARRDRLTTGQVGLRLCVCRAERGPLDFANFGRRDWHDAIDTAGIAKPARLYDLRSTFASNALARRVTVYELARILGSSVRMIELPLRGDAGRRDGLAARAARQRDRLDRIVWGTRGHEQAATEAANPHRS